MLTTGFFRFLVCSYPAISSVMCWHCPCLRENSFWRTPFVIRIRFWMRENELKWTKAANENVEKRRFHRAMKGKNPFFFYYFIHAERVLCVCYLCALDMFPSFRRWIESKFEFEVYSSVDSVRTGAVSSIRLFLEVNVPWHRWYRNRRYRPKWWKENNSLRKKGKRVFASMWTGTKAKKMENAERRCTPEQWNTNAVKLKMKNVERNYWLKRWNCHHHHCRLKHFDDSRCGNIHLLDKNKATRRRRTCERN